MTKECPMCGDMMRVHLMTRVQRVPGTNESVTRESQEWRCPECDYFEDVEDDEITEA